MPDDQRHLAEAAAAVCDQQERWAHAEFFHGMAAHQRADMAAEGACPWRGIMNPAVLHLIHVLEEMDLYASPFEPASAPTHSEG